MLRALKSRGVTPVLLTGDRPEAAQAAARRLGIGEVHAQCLPEDKLEILSGMERAGEPVCMVDDGINDAPSLKRATVGIAMGGIGSDIAVNAADIVLVDDNLRGLPHLLDLSRRKMTTISLNLAFAMSLNLVAVALAAAGILNPVTGALVHNAGSVFVIVCSALLLNWEKGGGAGRAALEAA